MSDYGYLIYILGADSTIDDEVTIAERDDPAITSAYDAQVWAAAQMGKTVHQIDTGSERWMAFADIEASSWYVTRYRRDTDMADEEWEGPKGRRSWSSRGPFVIDITDRWSAA